MTIDYSEIKIYCQTEVIKQTAEALAVNCDYWELAARQWQESLRSVLAELIEEPEPSPREEPIPYYGGIDHQILIIEGDFSHVYNGGG